jgi:hypothetical protein
MKKILLFLLAMSGWSLISNAQKLNDKISQDTSAYIFQLTNEELFYIYKDRKINDDVAFFDHLLELV